MDPVSTGQFIPPISPTDRAHYTQLFVRNAPLGLLDGNEARNIFLKSGLSNDVLIHVWNLCDTQNRGQLDQPEFVLAMHLLRSLILGTLKQLPTTLPPNVLQSFGSRDNSRNVSVSSTGTRLPLSPTGQRVPSVSRQYTGPLQPGQSKPPQQQEWSITPQDRAKFNAIFSNLDKSNNGFIGAEEVVPFMKTSNLDEGSLAQVWDLADVHNNGQFSKDEFAVAMYLVQQKLMGKTLPPTLPASLNPNSSSHLAPSSPTIPNSNQHVAPVPVKPVQTSALNDLLSLGDSLATPSPKPDANASQFSSQPSLGTHVTGSRAPFVPTSSFGQTLSKESEPVPSIATPEQSFNTPAQIAAVTGTQSFQNSTSSSIPQVPQQTQLQVSELSQDPEIANKLTNFSTENANLQNQVNSLSTQTDQAKLKREYAETELSRILSLKANLQSKLAALRKEYDSEVKRSNEAQQLLHKSQAETDKLSSECSVLEASYHAVQTQCQELSTQLAYDQQENSNLKEKIRYLNEETATLKGTLEKLQKDTKLQKGFLAVTRTQYAQAETERDSLQTQINDINNRPSSSGDHSTSRGLSSEITASNLPATTSTAGFSSVTSSEPSGSISSPSTAHSTNPFHAAFASMGNHASSTSVTPTFEDSFSQMNIASPSTTVEPARSSTHNTEETPNSSPPNSDYQYNPTNAPIPSFTLPLSRPESVTSSVQNNAPMSVREDADISLSNSPITASDSMPDREVDGPFSTTEIPIPPDGSNDSGLIIQNRENMLAAGDRISGSSNEPFEMIPRALGTSRAQDQSADSIETTKQVDTLPQSSNSAASKVSSSISSGDFYNDATTGLSGSTPTSGERIASGPSEFPPIRELEFEESDSDDDHNATAPHTTSTLPAFSVSSASQTPAPASAPVFGTKTTSQSGEKASPLPFPSSGTFASPFSSSTPPALPPKDTDAFDAAFQGLEAAKEETDQSTNPSRVPYPRQASGGVNSNSGFAFFSSPQETTTSSFQQPSVHGTAVTQSDVIPEQNTGVPVSNDEWNSIFSEFGASGTAVSNQHQASQNDINSAFGSLNQPQDTGRLQAVSSGTANAAISTPTGFGTEQQQNSNPPSAKAANVLGKEHDQALNELIRMGFDQKQAISALEKNKFNVSNATNYLLDH